MKSKGFNFFHIKSKSPVPVYGRTGLINSILRRLICDLSRFREKGGILIWGRLFTRLKMENKTVLTLGFFIIFTLFFFLVLSSVSSFYHVHYISFLVSILMFVPPSMLYKHGSI